ncbi:MAG TPA: oxygenase MpaB family protein [Terriglobales bacterium]|nr:oxygenase MpaB family protein [Terriglobales bacterium]
MPFRPVAASQLESLLAQLRASIAAPELGLFGPGSLNWQVNRESALFLAGGRAALLQLAHPWVAAAIAQHSRTLDAPVRRFHNTFRLMFLMSFGSVDEAFNAARRLHRMHESIQGTLPEAVGRFSAGSSYQANESGALIWVFATLIDSSLLAYGLALPMLSANERERYYAESLRSAALFGISPAELPPDLAAFDSYMQSALASDMLGVSSKTRSLAHQLASGAGASLPPPFWYRALTTSLLPSRFRQEFDFQYGERECAAVERALRWIRRIYPRLPSAIRFVGPYHEVQQRIRGRSRPSLTARLSNRLWLGRPSLFHPSAATTEREPAVSSRKVTES